MEAIIDKVLFIGDPHFKVNNNSITDVFTEKCLEYLNKYVEEHKEKFLCVIGGDLLDSHERLHQTPYNKMLKFIKCIKQICSVVILVGNHDYENNQQFLTDKHWMNALKEWNNVKIVDKVYEVDNLFFVPYVPPGRFIEALDTFIEKDWKNARCIFAHQEIRGCKLGVTTSEFGDKWPNDYPLIISGHIHTSHRPQQNVIYPGSIIQHSFSEMNNETGLYFIDFEKTEEDGKFTKIPVDIPRMICVNTRCEDFEAFVSNLDIKPLQRLKIICTGYEEQFKKIKKSKEYKNLDVNVKVVFKNINDSFCCGSVCGECDCIDCDECQQNQNENNMIHTFENILTKIVTESGDNLIDVFSNIINNEDFKNIVDKLIKTENKELYSDIVDEIDNVKQ